MLISQSLGSYTYKVVSHFDYLVWLRFFLFIFMTGMCLSVGIAQIVIDVPIDQLINIQELINSSYSFNEVEIINAEWSNSQFFGSIVFGGVNLEMNIGGASLGDVHNVNLEGGALVGSAFFSYQKSVLAEKRAVDLKVNRSFKSDFIHIPNRYLKNLGKASSEIVSGFSDKQGGALSRPVSDTGGIISKNGVHEENETRSAVYRLNDNGVQADGERRIIDVISVNGETVIDFDGGTRANPNILEAKVLLIPTENDTLIIKNWVEYSDYFLISREYAPDEEVLSRIQFKGYGRGAKMRYYNDTHWEIVPAPEVAAYGAFFGGVGLGLFTWRKRRRRRSV